MQLRPYQQRAVEFLRGRERGFIIAPAGSGKTIIAAVAMGEALSKADTPHTGVVVPRGLWVCNTREQLEQGVVALGVVEGPDEAEVEVVCAAAMPDASSADCLVIDEAHHTIATSWMLTAAQASGRVLGFSATPWMEPERDQLLLEFFGGIDNFHTITREEVLAGGHLAKGRVIIHDLDTRGEFDDLIEARAIPEIARRCRRFWNIQKFEHERRVRFQITQEIVQENRVRNAHAVLTARAGVRAGRSVLILIHSIEHGAEIAAQLESSVLVYSKIGAKKRRAAIADFKSGVTRCLIATSLADEGLDVPIASELILLGGGRSSAKMEQRTGRVMRPYDGKSEGLVHDYADTGARFAWAQSKAREKTYRALGYEIEHQKDC